MSWRRVLTRRGRRPTLSQTLWLDALDYSRYAQSLSRDAREQLRVRADEFLRSKNIVGAAEFEPTPTVRAVIAVKACIPILNLGIDCYAGWHDIVVYPGEFRVDSEYMDDAGIVHRGTEDLCGQSLSDGPMVLSWETIQEERELLDRDVVIHECAHKLDIMNGSANGFPPLPAGMSATQWAQTFQAAYDHFTAVIDADHETRLDPYAATDAAEFFAVLTETFFTEPAIVQLDFPAVYQQLTLLYRQDPSAVMGKAP